MEDLTQIVEPDQEEYSYGYIIEVLTGGLYHDKFHVIREYIQNGFDAINAYIKQNIHTDEKLGICVSYNKPSILIYDQGVGMNRDKINQYRKIGYSEKKIGDNVGFRGIGKLSGISVAEKLIVTSKQKGLKERYKIVFDAHSMLNEIIELKNEGKNKSLNELIKQYTEIKTEIDEDIDSHFTLVELYNVKEDSEILFDQEKLYQYISMNCPVKFDPNFQHANDIENEIKTHVNDYSVVNINLNGLEVYKPYIGQCKAPGYVPVWGDNDDEENPIAFCWYCENQDKGQFSDKDSSGLIYKFKNFAVGDRFLPRATMWKATPERAFYFFGEIYITMQGIYPSSERSNFEHNQARDDLYNKCQIIMRELNKKAGQSSNQHSALSKLEDAGEKITEISKNIDEQKIPVELQFDKAVETFKLVTDLEKRVNYLPEENKPIAKEIIEKGKNIVKQLQKIEPPKDILINQISEMKSNIDNTENNKECVYDIKSKLCLENQAARVYDIMVNVLKDFYDEDISALEKILSQIHRSLEDNLYKD